MNTPIATLLERASSAPPPSKASRSSWAPYFSVVLQLMANGYNVLAAVEWLIDQKEIKSADRTKAYRALLALSHRHEAAKKPLSPAK